MAHHFIYVKIFFCVHPSPLSPLQGIQMSKVTSMSVIPVSENKTLKLTNVLSRQIQPEEMQNLHLVVTQMQNYIKSHGAMPVGPLIQYTSVPLEADGAQQPKLYVMSQVNQMIVHLEPQYHMDALLRVKNCLYGHFVGPSEKLTLVYNKMNVVAYEQDIKLTGGTYTIYVKQDSDEMVTDVFMETR